MTNPSQGREVPGTLKVLIVWLLIGTAVLLGFLAWERQSNAAKVQVSEIGGKTRLEIARERGGHYHIEARINGKPIRFLIDTGATRTAISQGLARDLGLEVTGRESFNTANGVAIGGNARVSFEMPAGLLRIDNLLIAVMPSSDLDPLLGMDVLGKLKLTQDNNQLTMERAQ
jgi:aspartyl protease family protein